MPNLKDILGEYLVKASGEKVETSSLMSDNQIIGLYFTAHWCPPCRGFTPKLVDFYNRFKDHKHTLEIVFVSSDKDEDQFSEYLQEMPWCALPFDDRDRKAKLSKKYKVQSIPSLVMLEGRTANLITTDGRNNMLDDEEGQHFPWYPQPLSDLLSGPLRCGGEGGPTDAETALKGKVIGLYFSAHWCPPCRQFTPPLADVYKKLKDQGKNFEVVFVSSDRSEDSYEDYFKTMPWKAIPYGDNRNTVLAKHFGVQGIPTFIILDEKRDIVTTNGRGVISRDPEAKDFPWLPKPVNELNEITAPYLNESACLLFFTDGEEEHISKGYEVLGSIAQKYVEEYKSSDSELPELRFLCEGADAEDIADSLRGYAGLDDRTPLVVIMDIPEQQYYPVIAEPITPDVIQKLVSDYRNNRLHFLPLKR